MKIAVTLFSALPLYLSPPFFPLSLSLSLTLYPSRSLALSPSLYLSLSLPVSLSQFNSVQFNSKGLYCHESLNNNSAKASVQKLGHNNSLT